MSWSSAGSEESGTNSDQRSMQVLVPSDSKYFQHISRELSKERHSLYNRICSILEDGEFVEIVAQRYVGLPVLANLRCGLWYVEEPTDKCYFKSTDGHHGNWSFSLTRLNLNVVDWVAKRGGCIIVDATRKGKRFPDAMNKTIPIWSAVVNRVAAGVHGEEGSKWDTQLHLPIWVSISEKNQIESRLDDWVASLQALGGDILQPISKLRKPVRPLWLCPSSLLSEGETVDVSELPFCPIVLVSTSKLEAGARRTAAKKGQCGWPYVYVPGAGDDEESWAHGLQPSMLWANCKHLVSIGPHKVEDAVANLTQKSSQCPALESLPNGTQESVATDRHHPRPQACAISQVAVSSTNGLFWIGKTGIALGSFDAGNPQTALIHVDAILNCGLQEHSRLKSVRLEEQDEHPQLQNVADSEVSTSSNPMDPQDNGDKEICQKQCYLWCPIQSSKRDRASLKQSLPAALQFLSHHLQAGKRILVHDDQGSDACVCIVVALLLTCFSTSFSDEGCEVVFTNQHYRGDSEEIRNPSKDDVRRHLGFVTSCYSNGRPTRGMLKQVFNYCLESQQHTPNTRHSFS